MKTKEVTTAPVDAVVMPWDARAVELIPIHGPYCVYAAWCEWFEAWNDRQSDNMQLDIDDLNRTALFSAFQTACSETRSA